MAIITLNLGCGNDYRESPNEFEQIWINLDKGNCKADIHLDMEFTPWKKDDGQIIPNDYFDGILAVQTLEHISKEDFADVIREMYRISKPGAVWNIVVPHGLSDNFITDPTHVMPFSTRTFDYFIDETQLRENGIIYGWEDIKLRHTVAPIVDANQSIHFSLTVIK